MRDNPIQLAFVVLALVIGAGLEELLPKVLGVGFPFLLAVVLVFAGRGTALSVVLVSICAGAFEESISALPVMTAVSFCVVVGALARRLDESELVMTLAYPAYQVWLALWTGGLGGRIFWRMLVSVPIGLLTVVAVGLLWTWFGGKAAIDERD